MTFADAFVDPSIVESLQKVAYLPLLYPSYFQSGILVEEVISGILLYGPQELGRKIVRIQPSNINDESKCAGQSKKIARVSVCKTNP